MNQKEDVRSVHPTVLYAIEDIIKRTYSNDILQRMYKTFFFSLFSNNRAEFQRAGLSLTPKKPRKAQIVKMMVTIYANKSLFNKMLAILPPEVAKTFYLLIWKSAYNLKMLEEELNTTILTLGDKKPYYHFDPRQYMPIGYFFFYFHVKDSYAWRYGEADASEGCIIYLPDEVRSLLKHHIEPPDGYNLTPLNEVGKTDFVYENRGGILKELPLYYTYIQQGHLKVSKTGQKPMKASLMELKQYALSPEFYEGGALAFLKTKLIVAIILADRSLVGRNIDKCKNSIDLLKQAIDNYRQAGGMWNLRNLLFHLKGVSRVVFDSKQEVNSTILALLKQLPPGQWISIENLVKFVLLREIDLHVVDGFSTSHYLYCSKHISSQPEGYSYEEKIYMDEEYYNDGLLIPLIKGTMFLFAALGLVDIAYDYPVNKVLQYKAEKYLSVFDGVKYVRMTDLGAYISGRSRHYILPAEKKESAKIILDENRLIMTVQGEDRLKRMILQRLGDKIGENRYKMDYSSFLRECSSPKDIKQKIKLFKTEISSKPPQIWLDFFERALARVHPLIPQETMSIYKLSSDRELIHLMATDKILKKYILKAENFHIIVEQSNFAKVKHRLENLGYLF